MLTKFSKPRKHQRHKVAQRALVLVSQRIDALPFHIVDVSKGGLAYRYLGKHLMRSDNVKIDLYHESELIAEGLPVKLVSDYRLQSNMVPLRRGSFSFEALNSEQQAQVEVFINAFTEQETQTA